MLLGAFGTVITRMLQQKEEPQLVTGSPSPPLPPFIPLFFPCLILSLIHKQALLSCLVLAPRVASPAPAPAPTASAFLATVFKPKDPTQAPPCTKPSLVRPISKIALGLRATLGAIKTPTESFLSFFERWTPANVYFVLYASVLFLLDVRPETGLCSSLFSPPA